jgi:GWxTD domain-containing protein
MRKAASLAILFLLALGPAPAQNTAEKALPANFRDWLDLVAYHIQPVEREVFLKLSTDREREIFVEAFWKQRDPTPGTPQNEFREEIFSRFEHVNTYYGRSTSREGWRTDMGRYYMILGAPAGIERFEASSFVVPCQAWTYYGDTGKGLPTMFVLLFFQRGGVGEFRLYDPVSDGPAKLLVGQRDIDPTDYAAVYDKILEVAPTLADLSLSMIPGERGLNHTPSPRNNIILAQILESPKKDVNTAYATHFLDYKGFVSTEYLTNFVDSDAATAVVRDPQTGLRFLHFSVMPASVSVDYYDPKSQFFCSFQLTVSLRAGESVIFQYTRDLPIYIPENSIERVRANGLAIEDSFPVTDGRFRLAVLLTNSVGKEFSVLEKDIEIEPDTEAPRIGGPVVGYRFETYPKDVHVPFKLAETKLVVDPKMTFARADTISLVFGVENLTRELHAGGEARIKVRGLREAAPAERSYTVRLSAYPFAPVLGVVQAVPAKDLPPDYYELGVSLVGPGGALLDEKTDRFVVSPAETMGHPIAHAKGLALTNRFLYLYMLGQQDQKLGRPGRARDFFGKAFELNPDYREGLLMYIRFLIDEQDHDTALSLVERLREDGSRRFEYLSLRGRAQLGRGNYADAAVSLAEASAIYDSDVQVLNALGMAYHRSGQKAKALEALNASLRLNPAQADIKKLVAEIGK